MLDEERCYRAVRSRDTRFDGTFVTAVTSTGIYCRPSCPATTPQRHNVRFYRTSAAALEAGFRACKRCRPDATPGSSEWSLRADLVGRAMRLITDGAADRDGVGGLAAALGYTERHLHRQLVAEVGAGPQALARAQRAHTARLLLETAVLPVTEVAFAAGFASIRQFNDTIRQVYDATPTELRRRAAASGGGEPGAVSLRLAYREPYDAAAVLGFLAAHGIDGVEEYDGTTYRRTLSLPHGPGIAELAPGPRPGAGHVPGHVRCTLRLQDLRDLGPAVARCRRLLDLDADPEAVDALLRADPLLAPLVAAGPGRRVAGTVDGPETAVRAVLGQQVSVAGARRLGARITAAHGKSLAAPSGSLTHVFPTPEALAAADPAALPLTRARARTLVGLAASVADASVHLDAGADREEAERSLLALPGIGPWTAAYVRMRGLGDPDVFLTTDLGVRRALERLGVAADPASAARHAASWRPWRSYATCYLWSSL